MTLDGLSESMHQLKGNLISFISEPLISFDRAHCSTKTSKAKFFRDAVTLGLSVAQYSTRQYTLEQLVTRSGS